MERFPQNEQQNNTEQLKEMARQVADMNIQAANRYLEIGDPLKDRIISFYSERSETEQELLHVLGRINKDEISAYMQGVKEFTDNPVRFIERTEKIYELQDVHRNRKAMPDRVATDEEYELGVYADFLESQVRDAVLAANRKGYLTFQSGFQEKAERDQFMDFYNRDILIPDAMLKSLEDKSIKVIISKRDDRTTLTLHPVGSEPVRLSDWKEIWDDLIESLPPAGSEMVPNMDRSYGEYVYFRRKQDLLRR